MVPHTAVVMPDVGVIMTNAVSYQPTVPIYLLWYHWYAKYCGLASISMRLRLCLIWVHRPHQLLFPLFFRYILLNLNMLCSNDIELNIKDRARAVKAGFKAAS
jgi:hypothetical protein